MVTKKIEMVKPLCIILPEMNEYIKYFKKGVQKCLLIKDEKVSEIYEDICYVIKKKLGIKFNSEPVYYEKYIKAKVCEFVSKIKTKILGNELGKEKIHFIWIACVTTDSVMRTDTKHHPQVDLEQCRYRAK